MNTQVIQMLGRQEDHALMEKFLRWQCRVRQLAMREAQGCPDDAITPALTLPGDAQARGHVITVLSKKSTHSKTPELQHMVRRTMDPAQRREKAIEFFSETYYQHAREFSDTLTATFPPESKGAADILAAAECTLAFEAYNQHFTLHCSVSRLEKHHPLCEATLWHNLLFNPNLHPDTIVVGFEPNWERSSTEPAHGRKASI